MKFDKTIKISDVGVKKLDSPTAAKDDNEVGKQE